MSTKDRGIADGKGRGGKSPAVPKTKKARFVPAASRPQGISLRDYFAAKVAQGDAEVAPGWNNDESISDDYLRRRAGFYYRLADAMIGARVRVPK